MPTEVIGGRYRVESAIGRGGMGTVWLCRDERLQRDVAVKQVGLLPGESVTDSARALREARTSAALSHRSVVTVFDVVEEDQTIWLVMEYVPSRSMAAMVREEGALDPAVVAGIGAQVAQGLSAAHAAGTIHRDVKPGNVLVREDGVAKISDFGIARTDGDPTLTQSGFLTGTPAYFSPELARGAAPAPAADVWALGATLYAAVEGRPPYPTDGETNPMAVLHQIATGSLAPPRRAGPLEQPLRRMLDRDPGSRWSMADAAHALGRVADGQARGRPGEVGLAAGGLGGATSSFPQSSTAGPPAEAPPAPPRPASSSDHDRGGRRSRRARLLLVALAAAVVLLVAGAVLATTRHQGPEAGPAATGSSHAPTSSPSTSKAGPSPSGGSPSQQGSPSHSAGAEGNTAGPAHDSGGRPASKVGFLHRYYDTVPADLDTGWTLLSHRMQSVGRGSYHDFWGKMSSVDISRISTSAGSHSADATITYHYRSGRTSTERQRIHLVRSGDGGWLIDDDEVID